jgi:hypothetical protein
MFNLILKNTPYEMADDATYQNKTQCKRQKFSNKKNAHVIR